MLDVRWGELGSGPRMEAAASPGAPPAPRRSWRVLASSAERPQTGSDTQGWGGGPPVPRTLRGSFFLMLPPY